MPQRITKAINLRFLPVEKALILYVIVTGLFEIFYYSKLHDTSTHLLFRLFIVGVIVLLASVKTSNGERDFLRTIRVFLPFMFLGYFYKETDYLNNLIFSHNLDPVISGWENSIFGFQPSLSFSEWIHSDLFAELMYMGYFSYYLISVGIPLYIYFKINNQTGEKFGFIIISSFLIFYMVFIIFPVGGPQFYYIDWPQQVPDGYFFGHIMRVIKYYGEGVTAAFPSAHVSICLILMMGSFLYSKNLLRIILPVAIVLVFSTVYIRAHYVIDVLAGIILAPVLFRITSRIYDSFEPVSDITPGIGEQVKRKLEDLKFMKKG